LTSGRAPDEDSRAGLTLGLAGWTARVEQGTGTVRRTGFVRLKIGLLVAFAGAQMATAVAGAPPGYALSSGSGAGIGAYGFDTCVDPSEPAMNAWWPNTPWWWIGVYIGGSEMACSQPNLSAQWLDDQARTGWRFAFIWVGPQAPCTGFSSTFSSDPATAYQQGRSEGFAAFNALVNLGVGGGAAGTPLVYDLEAFDPSCQNGLAAAAAFVQGWVDQLHVDPPQLAGVYGSTCASSLATYAGGHPFPDFIWGASWDGDQRTSAMPCVDPANWASSYAQRLKQYVGGHDETWNGVTLGIDTDCATGPVAPTGVNIGSLCS
jgi:hypothetical protein